MDKSVLLIAAMAGLVIVNVAAFRYLGFFAFFVTAASIPFAQRILEIIEKMS